ncbi:hypothetical protein RMATCC62417_15818 [Rhizopus microsporus]|nr:hypothetical protein RMATCC62417_15818 [Rhizopus microsporus]
MPMGLMLTSMPLAYAIHLFLIPKTKLCPERCIDTRIGRGDCRTIPVQLSQIDNDLVDYLMKLSQVRNSDDLRRALHENSTYKLDFNDKKNKLFHWVHRSVDHLTLLYQNQNAFITDHSEQWFQTRVWLPLEFLFENIEGTSSIRGEETAVEQAPQEKISLIQLLRQKN